jgi:uncharacterized protein (TIGR00251 family)
MSKPQYITVKVIPKSPLTEIVETMADGTLKIRLKATPERGAANKELLRFLTKHFKADEVKIISGQRERKKLIRINHES